MHRTSPLATTPSERRASSLTGTPITSDLLCSEDLSNTDDLTSTRFNTPLTKGDPSSSVKRCRALQAFITLVTMTTLSLHPRDLLRG